MANKLIVSLSPHVHSGDSVQKNMYGVIIALVPALLVSFYMFGLGAVIVTLTSVIACLFFEWAITKYILKRERTTIMDGSAALTGILLAFNLPSNLPLWIIIIGALVAIGIGKMTFGGLGCNPFNPALVGRIFLLISFPVQMTSWPVTGQWASYTDAETAATPLALMKQAVHGDANALSQLPDTMSLFLGNNPGCIGEISALALLIGLVYMLWKKIISWHIPVSIIATVFVFSGLMHLANPVAYASPFVHLFTGGLMLGAIFMATDYVTSPMTHKGMIIYGVAIGFLTVVIRLFGAYPEGMSFAIFIMNAFTPLINTYCKPKRFGEVVKKLESSLKNMALALTGFSVVAGGLLGWVNDITAEPIAQANAKTLSDAIAVVVPGFDNNPAEAPETVEVNGATYKIYKATKGGEPIGAAVESSANGFGGALTVLVGFDNDGNIIDYSLLSHAETPGLGSKAADWFKKGAKGDITGKNPGEAALTVSKDGGQIDAITASTITSRAFLLAVNNAYAAYKNQYVDGASGATTQTEEADAETAVAADSTNVENN